MLQGFYWNSYDDTRWVTLEEQASDLAASFDLIWIPQSGNCGGQSMGYHPSCPSREIGASHLPLKGKANIVVSRRTAVNI